MEYLNFTLNHEPRGNEQPYCQQTIERVPRDPVENEPVTLFAMTDPVDAAERVLLLWTRDNWSETFTSEAVCLGNSDSVGNRGCDRYWTAVIPGQKSGGEIAYRFVADSGLNTTETGVFKFRPRRMESYDSLSDCRLEAGRLRLNFRSSRNDREFPLWITLDGQAGFSLVTGGRAAPTEPEGEKLIERLSKDKHIYGDCESVVCVEPDDNRVKFCNRSMQGEFVLSGKADVIRGEGTEEIRLYMESSPDEGFYGFGERYNNLNQRGHILHNRVYEQYTNQRLKTYMPIPFMFSTKNYGLYLDTDRDIVFDLCTGSDEVWTMKIEKRIDEPARFYLMFGGPKAILGQYTQLTGKPESLPEWAFGLWMSGNEWNTQERIDEIVAATEAHDIPAKVLVIEAWSDEATFYIWNGARYAPRDSSVPPKLSDFDFSDSPWWPDPKGMIDKLHEKGIKLILWQIPVLKAMNEKHAQLDLDKDYAVKNSLCAIEEDGNPYRVRPGWFQGSYLADYTNRDTCDWWMGNREYLLRDMGVDGFKTDGGEHLWGKDVRFSNGKRGDEAINTYPLDYIGAYHRFVRREKGCDGLIFSRSGYRGAQNYPCHWAGDQNSTWLTLRSAVRAMLNSGLSGVPFIGWDMGGFSGEIPSAELYLRSAAVAVFCPVMQYHTENNGWREPCVDRTPWNLAERYADYNLIACFREWVKLRERLVPYIAGEALHSCNTGEPLMRPMLIDFWDDESARDLWDQYLFGRSLLVAPIFEEGALGREVYLPLGEWTDCWTGDVHSGPAMVSSEASVESIPLYLRNECCAETLKGIFEGA